MTVDLLNTVCVRIAAGFGFAAALGALTFVEPHVCAAGDFDWEQSGPRLPGQKDKAAQTTSPPAPRSPSAPSAPQSGRSALPPVRHRYDSDYRPGQDPAGQSQEPAGGQSSAPPAQARYPDLAPADSSRFPGIAPPALPVDAAPAGPNHAPAANPSGPPTPPALNPLGPPAIPRPPRVEEDRVAARNVSGPSVVRQPSSSAMTVVERQAHDHIRHGLQLGNRRAWYSARAEFVQALRVLTQGLDVEAGANTHSQALADGLRALDEADNFVPRDGGLEAEINVALVASVHRTPVVRMTDEAVTPLVARQKYYSYAQSQLGLAGKENPVASVALESLGKLYTTMATDPTARVVDPEAKAMALHQAALLVDNRNAVAANELGVHLARFGRLPEAKAWLQHSASVAPQPDMWHNLAVVHSRLGEVQEAEKIRLTQLASHRAGAARVARADVPEVRWVSPAEMARALSSQVDPARPASNQGPSARAPGAPAPRAGTPASQAGTSRVR